jgi:hypothetical protein
MTQESTIVLPSSNNVSIWQRLGGLALIAIAAVLGYSLQLDPVLQAPKLAPVVISLLGVCAFGGLSFLFGAPHNTSAPVRFMQALFILFVFSFLGTLIVWIASVS